MKANHHFIATCVISLQLSIVALCMPIANSFFRDDYSLPINTKVGNSYSRKGDPKCLSSEDLRRNDISIPSNDPKGANEKRFASQQRLDTSQDAHEDKGLVFEGRFNYQSDIVPIPTAVMSSQATDLFEFFSDPKNRDLAIKGGGNPCESIPLTPELQEEWNAQSTIVNSIPPGVNDENNDDGRYEEILAVFSEVPIVPGLSLRAVSYTGCKTMKDPISNLPYYEFTLLRETYQPVGKKAMTWIFDKITGNNKKLNRNEKRKNRKDVNDCDIIPGYETTSSDKTSKHNTYALCRVMLKPFPQDGGCKLCYYGHVKLTLPKKFLHILPLPTRVVQKKVNKSIRKQLERECIKSIQKFTGALNNWNDRVIADM